MAQPLNPCKTGHCCARFVNQRTQAAAPRPPVWCKALRCVLPLLVASALELYQEAEEGGKYRFPMRLYIDQAENDANTFLKKVASVTAQFSPPQDESG